MDYVTKQQYAALLIFKEQTGMASEGELRELSAWLDADAAHRDIYNKLKNKDFSGDIATYREINVRAGLERYRTRYRKRPVKNSLWWSAVAAALILLLGVPSLFYILSGGGDADIQPILPGTSKAVLVLNDGGIINLAVDNCSGITVAGGAAVINDGSEINYTAPGNTLSQDTAIYHELHIPKGGEYMLKLADGTKVWINSQTKLKYPVRFGKMERKIFLEGEAYFEVAKDKTKPFYVVTKDAVNVEVLGTSFNVRAYPDEETIEAVLEEGAVRMKSPGSSVLLVPGNKSVYSRAGGQMSVAVVDTGPYTEWRHGQFVFYRETVEHILKRLSRWYDINVFYKNDLAKEILFSGSIKKYDTINVLLEVLEMAGGITFEINEHTLIVDISR